MTASRTESRRELQQHARILAGKVLSDLQIKEPDEIDFEAIAAHYDCFVRDGGLHGADGRVCAIGQRAVIRIRADITDEGRRRYIIAHEFGHVRHKHESALAFCSDLDMARYDVGGDRRAEAEANAFAAELLMPGRMFKARMGSQVPTLGLAEELAPIFRTTFNSHRNSHDRSCERAMRRRLVRARAHQMVRAKP